MNSNGSPQARLLLTTLSNALNMNETALRIALDAAFDLFPSVQNSPQLALHITLVRLGFRFEVHSFYNVLNAVRPMFASMLNVRLEKNETQVYDAVSRVRVDPYRAFPAGFPASETSAANWDYAQVAGRQAMALVYPGARAFANGPVTMRPAPFLAPAGLGEYPRASSPSSEQSLMSGADATGGRMAYASAHGNVLELEHGKDTAGTEQYPPPASGLPVDPALDLYQHYRMC